MISPVRSSRSRTPRCGEGVRGSLLHGLEHPEQSEMDVQGTPVVGKAIFCRLLPLNCLCKVMRVPSLIYSAGRDNFEMNMLHVYNLHFRLYNVNVQNRSVSIFHLSS
jgi:hypothetical protein